MAKYLTIDADAHGLLIAVGTPGRDKLIVERIIAATDLAQPLTVSNAALIGERLKQLLKEAKVGTNQALVVLGRDRIILKDIKHPPVPPQDEPGVIRFQALKEVAEGSEDMVFDYVPMRTGSQERRAMVAFVRKDALAAVRTMCETAGLKLAGVTPRPFAAAALLNQAIRTGMVPMPDPPESPVAVVVLHEAGGEFTVLQRGAVTMTRTIPSQAVASENTLIGEIRRNLAVANQDIQCVYLAEAETRGEGWSGRLRAALGLPVEAFDPLLNIPAAAAIPPELHGRFLGPIGLLAARNEPSLPINFIQPRQPRRAAAAETPAKKRTLIFALAAVLLLGVLGIGGWLMLSDLESKNKRLRGDLESTKKKISEGEIDAKRLAAVVEYENRSVNWLDEYYEQAARFPDIRKLKMKHFLGVTEPLPTEKERAAEAAKPAAKNAPVKKVGKLTLTLEGDRENTGLADGMANAFHKEPAFYNGATFKSTGSNGAASKAAQTFTIEIGVGHRKPEDYKLLVRPVEPTVIMTGTPPPKPAEKKDGEKKPEEKKEEEIPETEDAR